METRLKLIMPCSQQKTFILLGGNLIFTDLI